MSPCIYIYIYQAIYIYTYTYYIHMYILIVIYSPPFSGGWTYPKCKLHFWRCFWGGLWQCKLTCWRNFEDPPHKNDTWGTFSDQFYTFKGGIPNKCILHFGMVPPWKVALKGWWCYILFSSCPTLRHQPFGTGTLASWSSSLGTSHSPSRTFTWVFSGGYQ